MQSVIPTLPATKDYLGISYGTTKGCSSVIQGGQIAAILKIISDNTGKFVLASCE